MTVHRYPLGGTRELRIARSPRDHLVVMSVHDCNCCVSGPLAVPAVALDTLRSALADVAGETGNTEASVEPERAATRTLRSQEGAR
jgi:hypothetical protein